MLILEGEDLENQPRLLSPALVAPDCLLCHRTSEPAVDTEYRSPDVLADRRVALYYS